MALKERFDQDLKAALLGGNRQKADVLRGLKAVILNEEVAKGVRDTGLSDGDIEVLLAREVKKRNESATVYEQAGRPELVAAEKAEAEIIASYLPEQVSENDLAKAIDEIIAGLGDVTPQQMGQVIGAVKAKFGNSADGAVVARLVKARLN